MNKVNFALNVAQAKQRTKPLFSVINTSGVLQILESVLVEQNGKLKMTATDLENIVSVSSDVVTKEEFKFCLSSRVLKPFINDAVSEEIIFSGDEKKLVMSSEGFNISATLNDVEHFPKEVEITPKFRLVVNSQMLSDLFKSAIKFVSNDDLRPAMTGVNICDMDGKLFIISTDAHRLFYKPLTPTPPVLKGISIIVPAKTAKLFIEMFNNEEVVIDIDERHIRFSCHDKYLTARLIDAKYPNAETIIKTVCEDITISLKRKQFNAFIKLAEKFVNNSTKQVELLVSQKDIQFCGGDVDEDFGFDFKLPVYNSSKGFTQFTFAVNISFLKQAASIHKNDEFMVIKHSGDPTKIFSIDGCVLTMPLMLNNYK